MLLRPGRLLSPAIPSSAEQPWTPAVLEPALFLDASDVSTLFQDVAGSTPVAADGNPVGMWCDKGGDDFHLLAAADDTTRPTYKTSGGLHWVEFDGSNDVLRRLESLELQQSCSLFIAARVSPSAAGQTLFGQGYSVTLASRYLMMRTVGEGGVDMTQLIANEEGSTLVAGNGATASAQFGGTDVVHGFVDINGVVSCWNNQDDVTEFGGLTYFVSGTFVFDATSLGARVRGTVNEHIAARVYALCAVRRALTTQERQSLITYLGQRAGLTV